MICQCPRKQNSDRGPRADPRNYPPYTEHQASANQAGAQLPFYWQLYAGTQQELLVTARPIQGIVAIALLAVLSRYCHTWRKGNAEHTYY